MSTAAVVFSGFFFLSVLAETGWCVSSRIGLGSRLSSEEGRAWVSENGTFAFGFTPTGSTDKYQLAIWFAELSGDRTVVWSAN
ncbi:non-specific serine,threonine protein kinase, partial [Sarracenia purpurea var. burkii]